MWVLPKFFPYTFFFFHSSHYLCLSLTPSDSAFFCFVFCLLCLMSSFHFLTFNPPLLTLFVGQKMGRRVCQTTLLSKVVRWSYLNNTCQMFLVISSNYEWKNDRITFPGEGSWNVSGGTTLWFQILCLLFGSIKKTKESRSSIPKLKPRISAIRKDFQCYQHPFMLKYIKSYFCAALEK